MKLHFVCNSTPAYSQINWKWCLIQSDNYKTLLPRSFSLQQNSLYWSYNSRWAQKKFHEMQWDLLQYYTNIGWQPKDLRRPNEVTCFLRTMFMFPFSQLISVFVMKQLMELHFFQCKIQNSVVGKWSINGF